MITWENPSSGFTTVVEDEELAAALARDPSVKYRVLDDVWTYGGPRPVRTIRRAEVVAQ